MDYALEGWSGPGSKGTHVEAGSARAMRRVTVIGAGGMGTALALLLSGGGREVRLWGRHRDWVEQVSRTRFNDRYLPGIPLPPSIRLIAQATEALASTDLVVAAIPSAYLRETLTTVQDAFAPGVPVLSVVKGIERETFARPTQIVLDVLGERPVAVLSGPSHAEEIARGMPASVVVASADEALNHAILHLLNTPRFRVYTNTDVVGVELAGALKNVIGIAAGICDGLGFGDNAKAALLTRGLAEMRRYGEAHGAEPSTYLGLAGVGDLITTCFSPFGRNRALGEKIGRGATLAQATAGARSVAEGAFTARSASAEARRLGLELPITVEVDSILHDGKAPLAAVSNLMLRAPREEL